MYEDLICNNQTIKHTVCLSQDARRATELETVMEKQKMKVDLKLESGTL